MPAECNRGWPYTETFKISNGAVYSIRICGRSVAWSTRLPVTEKITGSNPAARAVRDLKQRKLLFVFVRRAFPLVQTLYI